MRKGRRLLRARLGVQRPDHQHKASFEGDGGCVRLQKSLQMMRRSSLLIGLGLGTISGDAGTHSEFAFLTGQQREASRDRQTLLPAAAAPQGCQNWRSLQFCRLLLLEHRIAMQAAIIWVDSCSLSTAGHLQSMMWQGTL